MITHFRVQNYKALRDVSLELTPLHLLIGPNDSGKTSILEAIAALCRSVDHGLAEAFAGSWTGMDLVSYTAAEPVISFSAEGDSPTRWTYVLACRFIRENRTVQLAQEVAVVDNRRADRPVPPWHESAINATARLTTWDPDFTAIAPLIRDALAGVHYYRWIPRLLSIPVAPDSRRRFRMEPTGFGLALCLDEILGFDREAFIELENEFRGFFPQIRSIKLLSEPGFRSAEVGSEQVPSFQRSDGKGLHFQYVDGPLVPAAQVSDGVLLVLAYLTILHLPEPPRVLLIEEPENGIHPARLRDVLKILRKLVERQDHTQVVLTTHSPYVVDLFRPEEVTLTRKEDNSSVAVRRLSESDLVRRQADVFTLGEIWTAEGDEAISRAATTAAPAP